jgi:hypothetical protein
MLIAAAFWLPMQSARASVATMSASELEGFSKYPPAVQSLIRKALYLTTKHLSYRFGSCNPATGGMDCSGAIFYLLVSAGAGDSTPPRQSDEMCAWMMRRAKFHRTQGVERFEDAAFAALRPGDLIFWTGTWNGSARRSLPISHVMLYLGRRKTDGKPVLFGSSDGRSYEGQHINGVSVFDFKIPRRGSSAAIYGYGPIPGMR